ncbi:hypothetical protein F5B22DRAFT_84067 [Xylaria bambusicola]|uniref:uncharacterized protein n=1 Tax=Xylaria bambusicola TaxID=326684 RepID=UPI002008E1BD|nr:uncharacterized protein F5B22DRAFT_84067 [Xylaria bambusicola]KAI0517928.1 hypothetical protein F5B22DRAFT_84067 [Xylaria bambusicola]
MDTFDQVVYRGVWVILFLYAVSTTIAFVRQSYTACVASLIFACVLLLDLSLVNVWFFIPSFLSHLGEIGLHVDSVIDLVRVILTSDAAQDAYTMLLGSFGSGLAVFNAASMLQNEAMRSQKQRRSSECFIDRVYRVSEYLDVKDRDGDTLPVFKS